LTKEETGAFGFATIFSILTQKTVQVTKRPKVGMFTKSTYNV